MTNAEPTPIKSATRRAPAKRAAAKRAQPHKPANVKQPQDRKKSAAQIEAEGTETVTVEWEGMTFHIASDPDEWDFWTVTRPLAAGNVPVALTGLLGGEQTALLRQARPRLTNTEARDLFNTINEAVTDLSTGN
ncbi:hypothetical protein CH278_02130 [Rhodococcus sp. 05-2254-5]|jgi:hypothetical protein|uniref:hypothetical protein n=1 Tax=unclassified Rhodococcus (in: high G+C Gram-positive bacteria) TaxID=192944 RepID=UPI000B9AF9C4|nr:MULTISPECIES: hypothetical protein [unclassified Rhodococcus (in: high G+C Gram-positive bacteria)]OZE39103.1 hypothetical protein CH278_02130 [Rhodococcus sp. 05-2254-5]OZE59044.1 hypothetical protein CH269_08625 [Rhodococcus sp. 05-2254-1]